MFEISSSIRHPSSGGMCDYILARKNLMVTDENRGERRERGIMGGNLISIINLTDIFFIQQEIIRSKG